MTQNHFYADDDELIDYPHCVFIKDVYNNPILSPIIKRLLDNFIDCSVENVFKRTEIPKYFEDNNITKYKIIGLGYTTIGCYFKNKEDAIKFKLTWL